MNKFLVFAVLFSVLFGASIAFAAEQGVEVTVGQDIKVTISPANLSFGSVSPGTINNPATNGPIILNATGSNDVVNVEVTSVTGFPFANGLRLDGASPIGRTWSFPCALVDNLCTYTIQTTVPTLNIPAGTPKGNPTGTIVYTVAGGAP